MQGLLIAILLLMLSLNVLFIVDLTLNHDAHSEWYLIAICIFNSLITCLY